MINNVLKNNSAKSNNDKKNNNDATKKNKKVKQPKSKWLIQKYKSSMTSDKKRNYD